ncbi:hypothetical protein BJ138DRAFT_1052838 [Hygrophoropsis aurantiaca]|uniref:Uncharacterized protein n=1 Tax=Hygrophoropsis aurantiaca TaxID=72124 RepID=A0ACB8AUK9_9AGAM|nr:hypothetical protein BJ138DRAFT_1052838 [Hygrophoropsis aurantiaca]
MNCYPALPTLEGDIMLDVFTHRSMLSGITHDTTYGDTERLAELGESVFEMIITYILHSERPVLQADELMSKKERLMEADSISEWLSYYGLKNKVRCLPEVRETLDSPEETRFLFYSYIGALYSVQGFHTVLNWISKLIDPASEPRHPPSSNAMTGRAPSVFSSRSSVPPPPPSQPPPTAPPPPPSTLPTISVLAIFNQTMTQQGSTVEYPAESSGPSHQPRWVVRCIVNGVERGQGIGRSQKIAKEEAAKQAFAALGLIG